jgi:hypothetical protein
MSEPAVLVVAGIESRELFPERCVLGGGCSTGCDTVVSPINEDFGVGVGLKVEPPGRDVIAAGVRGDHRERVSVPEVPNRRRAALTRLSSRRGENQQRQAPGEEKRTSDTTTAPSDDGGVHSGDARARAAQPKEPVP